MSLVIDAYGWTVNNLLQSNWLQDCRVMDCVFIAWPGEDCTNDGMLTKLYVLQ